MRQTQKTARLHVPQTLNLTTNGSFRVLSAKDTSVRCGPKGTARTIQYEIEIGSRVDLVDQRGFIVDWRDVSMAVAKKYRVVQQFPSCESFAAEICDLVGTLLENRCVFIHVKVGINGLPAHMTAQWTAPETHPVWQGQAGALPS